MQEEVNKPQSVGTDFIIPNTGGVDYKIVDDGEPIKAHITDAQFGEGVGRNFNTGEPEDRLIFKIVLDEGEGEGQVYSQRFKPSYHAKANMTAFVLAVTGAAPEPGKFAPASLVGSPLRVLLITKAKDGVNRQYIDKVLKPAAGQKKVDVPKKDVVPAGVEISADKEVNLDELDF